MHIFLNLISALHFGEMHKREDCIFLILLKIFLEKIL